MQIFVFMYDGKPYNIEFTEDALALVQDKLEFTPEIFGRYILDHLREGIIYHDLSDPDIDPEIAIYEYENLAVWGELRDGDPTIMVVTWDEMKNE